MWAEVLAVGAIAVALLALRRLGLTPAPPSAWGVGLALLLGLGVSVLQAVTGPEGGPGAALGALARGAIWGLAAVGLLVVARGSGGDGAV